jgi:hypothetical protein
MMMMVTMMMIYRAYGNESNNNDDNYDNLAYFNSLTIITPTHTLHQQVSQTKCALSNAKYLLKRPKRSVSALQKMQLR